MYKLEIVLLNKKYLIKMKYVENLNSHLKFIIFSPCRYLF